MNNNCCAGKSLTMKLLTVTINPDFTHTPDDWCFKVVLEDGKTTATFIHQDDCVEYVRQHLLQAVTEFAIGNGMPTEIISALYEMRNIPTNIGKTLKLSPNSIVIDDEEE